MRLSILRLPTQRANSLLLQLAYVSCIFHTTPPDCRLKSIPITAVKTSKAIQAAECSHNTRTSKQTFAVFTTDHQYDKVNGAPYGTCEAYNCAPGTSVASNEDSWTFYWDAAGVVGEESGEGAGCIKSPDDGTCGCENSDGTFVYGGSDCV